MKYGYEIAYKLACEKLAEIDIEQQCLQSGAQYQAIDSKKVVLLDFINKPHQISLPDGEVGLVNSEEEVPLREKVLILHYFLLAKGTPPTNKLVTYKELPQEMNYFPTFSKRTIKPILHRFGNEPEQLLEAAKKLGGSKADYGDVAATINGFKYIPITFVLWRGDDEFPPAGSVLFDSNASDYLSEEDKIVLCEMIAWRLVRA